MSNLNLSFTSVDVKVVTAHLESRLQRKSPLTLDLTHFALLCEHAAICQPLYLISKLQTVNQLTTALSEPMTEGWEQGLYFNHLL